MKEIQYLDGFISKKIFFHSSDPYSPITEHHYCFVTAITIVDSPGQYMFFEF